jgi:hypothetical protein
MTDRCEYEVSAKKHCGKPASYYLNTAGGPFPLCTDHWIDWQEMMCNDPKVWDCPPEWKCCSRRVSREGPS